MASIYNIKELSIIDEINEKLIEILAKDIGKAFYNGEQMSTYGTAYNYNWDSSVWDTIYKKRPSLNDLKNLLKPERVIFNNPATIVYWNDGSKTVVKCSENEEFIPEVGLAMAFIRKIYPNRSEFLKFLETAYYQEDNG